MPFPAPPEIVARLESGLEPEQLQVLRHRFRDDGPLLVLAGAGTGKTTVLTRRLALECASGVDPETILALTFTRKAAEEMRHRASLLLPPGSVAPRVRTFHSLGLSILSEDDGRLWRAAGWNATPRAFGEQERSDVFARFWQDRFRTGTLSAPSAGEWNRATSRYGRPEDAPDAELSWKADWMAWEVRKRELGFWEHHDLVASALTALEADPERLAVWRERSEVLLVDEYQDTDRTQYRLVHLLAGGRDSLLAVGDDDQSIYGFRGADLRNVLDWLEDHPNGKVIALTANHRSLSPILDASNRIFPDKPATFRKILRSRRSQAVVEPPLWYRARDPAEEIGWIKATWRRELGRGRKWDELCLLVRANRELDTLRQALGERWQIQTIHAAKGLEWPVVCVFGQDRSRSEGGGLLDFQSDEERRLFYVACTRARDRLYLTSCERRERGDDWDPRRPHPWMDLVGPALVREPGLWARLRRILA